MAAPASRSQRYYHERQQVVAVAWRRGLSESQIERRYGFTRDFVRYWIRKAQDQTWHQGSLGGARHFAFTAETERKIEAVLWTHLYANPTWMLDEFAAAVQRDTGVSVQSRWISRTFVRWGFSRKVALYKQVYKYTLRNVIYYCIYVSRIDDFDPVRLKFCDESHFASRR
jgi:transposase